MALRGVARHIILQDDAHVGIGHDDIALEGVALIVLILSGIDERIANQIPGEEVVVAVERANEVELSIMHVIAGLIQHEARVARQQLGDNTAVHAGSLVELQVDDVFVDEYIH